MRSSEARRRCRKCEVSWYSRDPACWACGSRRGIEADPPGDGPQKPLAVSWATGTLYGPPGASQGPLVGSQ